jgi:hypothetical protein
MHAEFLQDPLNLSLHRYNGYGQALGNLIVLLILQEEQGHFPLAARNAPPAQ